MGEYDRQIATPKRLIAKKGQACKWRQIATELPDPDKPWEQVADGLPVDNDCSIVFLPPDKENKKLIVYLTGAEVTTGFVYGLMAAVSFTPSAKDIVLRDGKELRIKSIDPLAPNGQIILYTIEFEQ